MGEGRAASAGFVHGVYYPYTRVNKKVIKKQKDPRITQKRCQKVDER